MTNTLNIAVEIRNVFQERHDALVNDEKRKILVSHFGSFSQELVGSLSNSVEQLLISKGDKRVVIKRMFSILLEGLQNIRIHGARDEGGNQLGYLLISEAEENYKLVMANMMLQDEKEKVINYLNEINDLPDADLKEKYMAVLSSEFLSQKGGAGLGLITTRIKSGPLSYNFSDLNEDKLLFSLEIILPRVK